MAKGRPPELVLDPDFPGPVAQAVLHVDERGRFQLPIRLTGGWITKGATSFALAVLIEPGVVRIHPWNKAAESVLERRRELIEKAANDSGAIEILRALEDRYKRFQIPLGARPTLSSELIVHLGLEQSVPASIYAWRIEDVVELTSRAYRIDQLKVDWDVLADLPR